MLNPEDIEAILNDRIIPNIKNTTLKKNNEKPDYYPGYLDYASWRERIRVHAELGTFPEKLLMNRAPNATEKEWDYVKDNYQQITLPLAIDYQSTLGRAWSDNNWSITYKTPKAPYRESSLQRYIEHDIEDTPLKMSLEDYFKTVFAHAKMVDSMGCIAIKPHKQNLTQNENGEYVQSAELIEPIPVYYSCEQLVAYEEDSYYMFELFEKSVVEYSGKPSKRGYIYEIYDDEYIWRVEQVGQYVDYEFRIYIYYDHRGGDIPVNRLKGKPVPRDGKIVWESRFMSAVPLLDEVVLDAVYLRAIKNLSAFPYRVMKGEICNYTMEFEGETQYCNGNGWFHDVQNDRRLTCPQCQGEGVKDRVSPYGVMLLRPDSPFNQGEDRGSQAAMYYVAPDPDIPEFIRAEIERNYVEAAKMLHLYLSEGEEEGHRYITATQKALDMKATYAFVKQDSDQTFGSYEWAIKWINFYRYNSWDEDAFTLTYPHSFDFYTDYDYLDQVSGAVQNGLPPFLVQQTIMKYVRSLFGNDLISSRAYDLIAKTDRLMTMNHDEVNIKQTKGLIAPYEVILHDSGMTFIMELYEDDEDFFNKKFEDQQEALIEKAKKKAEETKLASPNPTETILAISNARNNTEET